MYYYFKLTSVPTVLKQYTVTRNTIWEITECEHLLIFIREGTCQFTIQDKTYTVSPGDIIYIPANQRYIRKRTGDTYCTMTYIHFALTDLLSQPSALDLFHFIEQEQTQLDHAIFSSNLHDISCFPTHIYLQTHSSHSDAVAEQIEECLKAVSMHINQRTLMTSLLLSSNLCMILALLSHSTIQTINNNIQLHNIPEIPPKLKLAINYIVNHYSEQITLDALAQHCHVSKQQLIRYFNVAFHTTPINYVTDFKLSRAKELLFNHPEISVKEIAAELGFDNQHYFSRVFKSKNGETPSEYRKRIFNYIDTEI